MFSHSEGGSFRGDTLRLVSALRDAKQRPDTARALARHLGAEDLIVFIPDTEVGVLLPAAGMPQTLPNGRQWHAFLNDCQEHGLQYADLPFPDSESFVPATGLASDDESVLVLLGAHLSPGPLEEIRVLMPLLAAALQGEHSAMIASTQAEIARTNTEMANSLMSSLDSARQELQRHLQQVEINQRERAFLAHASAIMSASLDLEETLEQTVQLVVPQLADYAAIDLLHGNSLELVALESIHPEREARIHEARARHAIQLADKHPVAIVARNGRAIRMSELDEHQLESVDADSDYTDALKELNIKSVLLTPLIARDRTIGVLQLAFADSDRRYGSREQALAEDLSARAALAIENALLYRTAQEAGRAREEFLSIASHELKTPLTTVKGYIQILLRNLHDPTGQYTRITQSAHQLDDQVTRIEALVNDLLDVSRIRRGRLELRPETTNLCEIAKRVLDRFEEAPERNDDHQLELRAPVSVLGYWDPFRIEQVLSNLISNGLKYSPSGGMVSVEVWSDEKNAYVAVRDEGIGISTDVRERLFEPFYRDPQMSLHVGGTGLGLYISKQIIESHGGSMHVSSQEGYGSTFTIALPRETGELTGPSSGESSA